MEDFLIFLAMMLGIALIFLLLALAVHRRRIKRKADFTDPRRDRLYHNGKKAKRTLHHAPDSHHHHHRHRSKSESSDAQAS